jgi:hypothetical protein
MPIAPFLLQWPSSSTVPQERLVLDRWLGDREMELAPPSSLWPPSPFIFGFFIFPVVRGMYKRLLDRVSHWVMDTKPTLQVPVRRFVWALNDDGPFNIRIGANVEPERQGPQQGPQQAQDAPVQNPPADAAAAAEHTIRVSGASLGRLIGGALIAPTVSNRMGALLFHWSKRSRLLRRVLAVRPPLGPLPTSYLLRGLDDANWRAAGYLQRIALVVKFTAGVVFGGTRLWARCDPVW